MRVAVTGASGYVGGWLLSELTRRGHEVHAQDVTKPDGKVAWLMSSVEFDLRDDGLRRKWLAETEPEVVIHLAALYGRVWGERDLIRTAEMNAGLTAAVARDTADAGARLMYASSSEVYGRPADSGPVFPDSPLHPLNMYGLTKKWGEEAARIYCPDGLMVTRLNMPYGPAFFPPSGPVTHTSGRVGPLGYNVLHSMVWQAEHGMDLVVHKNTTRCLTWVEDTMLGMALVLESGQEGTWNVSRDDDHITMLELARRVVSAVGSPSRVIEVPTPGGVTMHKKLDNTRLLELGWKPSAGLDQGIPWSWAYYRQFNREGEWTG